MANVVRKGIIAYGGAYKGDGTRVAEGTVNFGDPVQLGTDEEKQVKTYAGGTFWGVAVRDETLTGLDGSGNIVTFGYIPTKHPLSVLRQGYISVEVAEAVTAGDPVYIETDGTYFKQAGGTRDLISGAQYETDAAKDGLAILSLNLPA